jgi:hypothetical protein
MVFMKSKIPHYVSPAPPMGGMRFKFNYWRGGPLPTTYLWNAGRAGQGGIYMPLLLLLIGWHEFSSISKTGYHHFLFFSKGVLL